MAENIGISELQYNDVMVIIGFGHIHIRILITCGLLLMFTITETMGMSIISLSSTCDFGTTQLSQGVTQSAAFVGMILSSYIWGYYCDKIGRRTVLLRSTAMAIVFSFSSMLMTNFWVFLTLRFMTGLCVAGPGFAALTYLSEFCTTRNRAPIINYMSIFNGIAMVYCSGLAQTMINYKLDIPVIGNLVIRTWRLLGILFSVPGWISFLLLLKLPESPKFLLMTNRCEECFQELNLLCRLYNGKDLNDFGVANLRPLLKGNLSTHENLIHTMAIEVVPLFRYPYVKRFIISCIVMFGLIFVANSVAIWFTDIRSHTLIWEQEHKNISRNSTFTLCVTITYINEIKRDVKECNDQMPTSWDSILLGALFLIEYIIFGLMLLIMPRKPLFCITLVISGLSGLSLPFTRYPLLALLAFITFLSIPAVIVNLMSSAVVEFIPTYLRGKAMCIAMIFGRIGAVTGTTMMANLLDRFCFEAFIIFSMFPFACAIFGIFLPLDKHFFK